MKKKSKNSSKSEGRKERKLSVKPNPKNFPTLKIKKEGEIALDFSTKTYKKFDKMIKSIILFGSTIKETAVAGSDIDIVIIIDDVSIEWDQELIAWYREELGKIVRANPYQKELHINTIKLSTWWDDLLKGDPLIINIIRYGESLIDNGSFFLPLKYLLVKGKIRSTPEAIYNCLQRAPIHLNRSKLSELSSVEGLYWAMVDSAHAALIAAGVTPPSPEHIPINLKETFVDAGKLKSHYISWFRDLYTLHRGIVHGDITDIKGTNIDDWQAKTKEFVEVMAQLVKNYIDNY